MLQRTLIPADPKLEDMLNCKCEMIYRKPYGCAPITAIVTVDEIYSHRGITYFHLKPDAQHLTGKHVSEFEFINSLIRYFQSGQGSGTAQIEKIAVAA